MPTERVHFYSEGARLSGLLYLPDGTGTGEKKAGIVLCHGFTGIKEFLRPLSQQPARRRHLWLPRRRLRR